MALVDHLYSWLASGPTPECDYIFSEALEHAEEGWAERIIAVLERRGHDASIAALVACWERLDDRRRAQLCEDRERLWRAITLATRFSSPGARLNALRALDGCLTPRLAYLLPNLLRDRSDQVRELAARLLRRCAEQWLDDPQSVSGTATDEQAARNLLRAVEDALRTYDVHKRVETLEVALWFARELGQELWQMLHSTRSKAANGVRENLVDWNHPRLADFLLLALREPGWEDEAATLLREWRSPEEITALLERDALVMHRRWRTRLARIHQPRWLEDIGPDMEPIAIELRRRMPMWVRYASFEPQQRMALLSRWSRSEDLALRRRAIYALADLGGGPSHSILRQVAQREDGLGAFARWYLAGFDTGLLKRSNDEQAAADRDTQPGAMGSGELARLWQVCRRTPAGARGPLIETLREHARFWREPLRQYLRSADPRDRVLALQVISTRELAIQFRLDLEQLADDPIESIRRLAKLLIDSIASAPTVQPPPSDPPGPPTGDADTLQALHEALDRLETHGTSEENVGAVRELLRKLYGQDTGQPVQAASGESA